MKQLLRINSVFLTFVLLFSGCTTNRGSGILMNERFSYNEAIIRSQNEQMLLNLVRLRYNDVPLFLDLSGIVTQYSVTNSGGISGNSALTTASNAKPAATTTGSLNAGLSFNEKPTMTYSPLQGEEFATRILTPIAPETIVLLSQSGWSISRLFMLCVQRINNISNAANASGPTPEYKPEYEAFQSMIKLLRLLQRRGAMSAVVQKSGESRQVSLRFSDTVSDTSLQNAKNEVVKTLNLKAGSSEYMIKAGGVTAEDDAIYLSTRSLLGVLYFLSHAIEPPTKHIETSIMTLTKNPDGSVFDWNSVLGEILRIKTSGKKPDEAYVKSFYRDHWYYIADNDLNSKATFNLLHYLFALQSAEGSGRSPLLSLNLS